MQCPTHVVTARLTLKHPATGSAAAAAAPVAAATTCPIGFCKTTPVQCGFVARCNNPLQITQFQPILVPMGGGACTRQPLFVQPYFGGMSSASASANAASNTQAFADTAAQAFGAGEGSQ